MLSLLLKVKVLLSRENFIKKNFPSIVWLISESQEEKDRYSEACRLGGRPDFTVGGVESGGAATEAGRNEGGDGGGPGGQAERGREDIEA